MISRAMRPADLVLLALRTLLVLLVGAALAGPSFVSRSRGTARVVVVDRSAAASSDGATTDTARALFQPGDALVVFDSLAHEVAQPTRDSIVAAGVRTGPGSLSAALVVAVRAADRLRRARDSVAIEIVSPFAAEELDAATGPIRRLWRGPVRLVRAGRMPNDASPAGPVPVRAPVGDPVAAAYALAGAVPGGTAVRIVRDSLTAADSAWASAGRTVVVWPRGRDTGWRRAGAIDTAFAATVGPAASPFTTAAMGASATVVAPFVRDIAPPAGRAVAWWGDGAPAATETVLGSGCVRAVAIPVTDAGDLALTPAFGRVARRLAAPCDGRTLTPASDSLLAAVLPSAHDGARDDRVPGELTAPAPGEAAVRAGPPAPRIAAWLLGLALLAAVAELFLRREFPLRRGGVDAVV